MNLLVAVGGPRPPGLPGGWDLWPLVGLLAGLWLGRRIIDLPWRVPLLVCGVAYSLSLSPLVHAWGVVPAFSLMIALAYALRGARRSGSSPTHPTV